MDYIWANCINLSGLYSSLPVKCHPKGRNWIDDDGEISVERLGLIVTDKNITYSSSRLEDVTTWTLGVLAALKLIHRWSGSCHEVTH
jgi:hypothetical protein